MSTAAPVMEKLERAFRRLWYVPAMTSCAQWAERYVELDEKLSGRPGPFRASVTPHLREVLDAVSDPGVREMTFAGCTQIGKTTAELIMIAYAGRRMPGPGLLVYPTKEMAADVVRNRLRRVLRCLRSEEGERGYGDDVGGVKIRDGDEGTTLYVELERMDLWAVGSNAETALKSRPIKFALQDELEDFDEKAEELVAERHRSFPDYKNIAIGNPGLSEGAMWRRYLAGDRRRWQVPCPHCGYYQELLFSRERLVWDGGLKASEDQVRASVRYVCERCSAEILPAQRHGMLQRGVWVPEGMTVAEGSGELSGVATGPGYPRHRSWTMSHLSSPFVEWATTAAEFVVKQKGAPSMTWVNSVLGQPYTPPGEELRIDVVRRRFVEVGKGGYRADVVPHRCRFLTGGIDVQHQGFYVVVRGWGDGAKESWLIDAAWVPAPKGDMAATYSAMSRILATRYQLAGGESHPGWKIFGGGDGGGMPVGQYLMDSGDGPRTPEMYAMVRALGSGSHGAFLVAAKGVDDLGPLSFSQTYAERDVAVEDRTEKVNMELVRVSNWYWKELLAGHLLRTDDARGSGELPEGVARFWWPQLEEGTWMERYIEHVTNERRVPIRKPGSRRVVLRWVQRYANAPNHYFDADVLACCCGDVLGVARRVWEGFEQ